MKTITTTLLALLWALSLLTSPARAEAIAAEDLSYQLGSGDMIRIQVYGENDLTLEARITDTGTISYPFLGQVKVTGRTIGQLQDEIAAGLKGDYLLDPKVSVTILDYRQFYINGEVKKPGGFAFKPGLTVHKAISLAGGMTERASTNKISIVSESNPNRKQPADLNTRVRPGDIITIDQSFF